MIRWIAAFQCYALAADAAEVSHCVYTGCCTLLCSLAWQVWKYASAMAHLRVCVEIGSSGVGEKTIPGE